MSKIINHVKAIAYGALFLLFIFFAGNGYLMAEAQGAGIDQATMAQMVPTPLGGTIPVVSTGISVLHLAPFDTDPDVTTVLTSTTGATVASTGITIGERWAGSPIADSTQYLSFPSGNTQIAITPDGALTPILLQTVSLTDGADNTVVLTGGANGWVVDTLLLDDSTTAPPPFFGKVRIVHVAPLDNSSLNTEVAIVDQTGRAIDPSFNGLTYRDASAYITLPAGEYDWRANVLSNANVIDLDPFMLNSGAIVTIYILGDGASFQPAGLLVINELGNPVRDLYLPMMIE